VLTRWHGGNSAADLEEDFDEFLKMLEDEEAEAVNRQWREVGTWAQRWSPPVPHPFLHPGLGLRLRTRSLSLYPPPTDSPGQPCVPSIRAPPIRGGRVGAASSP